MANMLMVHTGIIAVKDNDAKCTVCGATCEVERIAPGVTQAPVKHKRSCVASNLIKTFMDSLGAGVEFIPKVENLIQPEFVQDYYADMTKSELEEIDQLVNDMFAAATERDRRVLEPRVAAYDNHDVSTPILQRVIKEGLNTPQDRANFKHFLVYLKSHQRAVDDFMLHAMHMEQERNEMSHLFSKTFDS